MYYTKLRGEQDNTTTVDIRRRDERIDKYITTFFDANIENDFIKMYHAVQAYYFELIALLTEKEEAVFRTKMPELSHKINKQIDLDHVYIDLLELFKMLQLCAHCNGLFGRFWKNQAIKPKDAIMDRG